MVTWCLSCLLQLQGGGGDLPKNGDYWHAIRRGELPDLPHYSAQINDLLKVCKHLCMFLDSLLLGACQIFWMVQQENSSVFIDKELKYFLFK